jgi:hypothetical protein
MTISGKSKGSGFQYVSAALQNDLFIEESWLWLDSNGAGRFIRIALKPLS